MKKFKPYNEKLLVRKLPEDEITKGGIILTPNTLAKNNIVKAEIVEVSDNLEENKKSVFSVGQKILYFFDDSAPMMINDEELFVIQFKNVLGIFE